jgi:hypothetical protein
MNDSTDQLLEELGGLGSTAGATPAVGKPLNQPGGNLPSTEKGDQWRILLVDLVYLLNASFRDAHYWEGVKAEKDTFKNLVNILHDLNQMPNHDGLVRILYRGSQGAKVSSKADYIIRFGDLNVDVAATAAVIKRMGIRIKHIEGRLIKAFEVLSDQGIETIFIRIPGSSEADLEKMQICLHIISRYKKAVSDDVPIEITTSAGKRSITAISNEYQQPDPNLTMLAALNDLGPANMQEMVQKVSTLMNRPDLAQTGLRSANVYKTIFNIKSLRQKLERPPIEVNSEKPSQTGVAQIGAAGTGSGRGGSSGPPTAGQATGVVDSGSGGRGAGVVLHGDGSRGAGAVPDGGGGQGTGGVSDGGGSQGTGGVLDGAGSQSTGSVLDGVGGVVPDGNAGQSVGVVNDEGGNVDPLHTGATDPTVLKASIARFVKDTYRGSPETGARIMHTIFSNDYGQLEMEGLEGRLHLLTDLLSSLQKSNSTQEFAQQVIKKIQAGVDQIPAEVLEDLVVQDDVIKIWDGEDEKIIGKADENLVNIIESSKERSSSIKKARPVFRPDAEFTAQDVDRLSETFNIPNQEAEEITKLFKQCFDRQGNFQRALFDKNVPEFARYPKRIFDIMWEFLRETPRRSNRLPFLNSLQLLLIEIQQPKQAIKTLISDFILNPGEVTYPDRNAMMLAIQFLRTYNKELNMDIEITPEEVLRVQVGLDKSVAHYTEWKVNAEQKKFIEKVITIRKKLLTSFELDGSDENVFPIRFLLALEREVHMFLALVGGKTADAVIQGALNVYGNPAAKVYQLGASQQYISSLLQHLAVLIRALGRIGQQEDLVLLDEIGKRQQSFTDLSEEPRHAAQVRRTMGWIESAKSEIRTRNDEPLV